jgi:hypothetical protein
MATVGKAPRAVRVETRVPASSRAQAATKKRAFSLPRRQATSPQARRVEHETKM